MLHGGFCHVTMTSNGNYVNPAAIVLALKDAIIKLDSSGLGIEGRSKNQYRLTCRTGR